MAPCLVGVVGCADSTQDEGDDGGTSSGQSSDAEASSEGDDSADASADASADDGSETADGGEAPEAWPCAVAEPAADPTVSFRAGVAPIFAARCNVCHHPDNAVEVDLTRPFDPELGIICRDNSWTMARSTVLVVPGAPQMSALIDKVSMPDLDPKQDGGFMPLNLPLLTEQELADLRQWITDGAQNDTFYQETITRIFGNGVSLGSRAGKCGYCHFPGGLPPDLTQPFDPATGAVDVDSIYGGKRIVPGDPDASVLMQKVDPELNADAGVGAIMPQQFEPLSADQIEILSTWVAEGAQNN